MDLSECMLNSGDYVVFRPFEFIDVQEHVMQKQDRIHQVEFEFAYSQKQVMQVYLPENLAINSVPDNCHFKNAIGTCSVSFTRMNDNFFSITYLFELKEANIAKDYFGELLKLMDARRKILSTVVLLNKIESKNN